MSTLPDEPTSNTSNADSADQPQDNSVRQPDQRVAVSRLLPGVGITYLDSEFANKLNTLEATMEEQGIPITYLSAYRTPAQQEDLRTGGTGVTPAKDSLHSAGLAVDMPLYDAGKANNTYTEEQSAAIISAAKTMGLRWGGDFKNPAPDPHHFDLEPTKDHKSLITNFTPQVQRLRTFR